MPRFAANLSFLFTEAPFLERFALARAAGFEAAECLFPYDFEAGVIAERLRAAGLTQVLFNAPPGDWDRGERGFGAVKGAEAAFEASVSRALTYAAALDCRRVHVLAGILREGTEAEAEACFAANLRRAAPEAARAGVTLLVEPLNTRDMPGYAITRTEQARRVIEAAGEENVGLQLDLYHRQIMQGDLTRALRDNADITRHIQVASPPDRHEPDDCEVNFPHLFGLIDASGYDGFVGCEYRPRAATLDGLGWFAPHRR